MANCSQCGRKLPPLTFGRKICQWCVQHEAAQRGEDSGEVMQRVIPAPWVRRESTVNLTQILFGANVAVFLAMAARSGSVMDFSGQVMVNFGANYGPYTLSGDWWRLLTYMFLHGGLLHIAFNMWCLWDLGALCESLYGRWTYFCIYLTTGVAAGLASIAWKPGVLSVGASGAIFGLAGALIASFYLGEFSLPRIAISGTLRSLIVFAVFNLFFGSLFPGIDNAAHIGGLVSGLILGALIARLAPEHNARRAGVLVIGALAVLAAGLGVRHWRSGPMRMARAIEILSENKADAVTRLQAVLKQNPNSPEAHYMLAQTYFNRQQYPQAEAEFKRVIELRPNTLDARYALGMTYLGENRPDDAKAAFTQMLTLDPKNADAHYGVAEALSDQHNDQAAVEEFKAALAAGADTPDINLELGNAYARLKKYDDAIAAYLKQKDEDGDTPDLENALADAYQAKGMPRQAQEARAKAAQLNHGPQS